MFTDLFLVAGGTDPNGEYLHTLESLDVKASASEWINMKPIQSSIKISAFGSSANSISTFNSRQFGIQGGTNSAPHSLYGDRTSRFSWRYTREDIVRRGGTIRRSRVSYFKNCCFARNLKTPKLYTIFREWEA